MAGNLTELDGGVKLRRHQAEPREARIPSLQNPRCVWLVYFEVVRHLLGGLKGKPKGHRSHFRSK